MLRNLPRVLEVTPGLTARPLITDANLPQLNDTGYSQIPLMDVL